MHLLLDSKWLLSLETLFQVAALAPQFYSIRVKLSILIIEKVYQNIDICEKLELWRGGGGGGGGN